MQIKMVPGEKEEEVSEEEEEEGSDVDLNESFIDDQKISQKHSKFTDLEQRAKDDMDFPDEVDTPVDQPAKDRFQRFRGIKTLKNCNWDPFENLPIEYSKIWRFQNFQMSQKAAIQKTIEEGLPISGTYIRIVFDRQSPLFHKPLPEPLILSTLFPHETKVSVVHYKLHRNDEDKSIICSKQLLEFQCGFRRFWLRPSLSQEVQGSDKWKYQRFLRHECNQFASAFG